MIASKDYFIYRVVTDKAGNMSLAEYSGYHESEEDCLDHLESAVSEGSEESDWEFLIVPRVVLFPGDRNSEEYRGAYRA